MATRQKASGVVALRCGYICFGTLAGLAGPPRDKRTAKRKGRESDQARQPPPTGSPGRPEWQRGLLSSSGIFLVSGLEAIL